MKYLILLLFPFVSMQGYGEDVSFINTSLLKKEIGHESACVKIKEIFGREKNNWYKSYYQGFLMSCYFKSNEYRKLNKEDKKAKYKELWGEKVRYINVAIMNKDELSSDKVGFISVDEDYYPVEFEYLKKKTIESELSKDNVNINDDEGDVHEVGPYIYRSYLDMAKSYLKNDMVGESDRIVSEFYGTEYGSKINKGVMEESIKEYLALLERKRSRQKERIESKKTIVNSQNSKKESNAIAVIDDSSKNEQKNVVETEKDKNSGTGFVEKQITEIGLKKSSSSIDVIKNYWLYILAFIVILGIYLKVRRKK